MAPWAQAVFDALGALVSSNVVEEVIERGMLEVQRDNLRVGRHDGVNAVIEKLEGHPLFAHVTLTRSKRSPIAALVTEMLEG